MEDQYLFFPACNETLQNPVFDLFVGGDGSTFWHAREKLPERKGNFSRSRRKHSHVGNPRDCEHPSTWAYLQWQGQKLSSRSPRLLVVGQDPSGLEKCTVDDWLPDDNPTNQNLLTLSEATNLEPSKVHLTNAVL